MVQHKQLMRTVVTIQRYYIASVRVLVRINGTTKAPMMNHATVHAGSDHHKGLQGVKG
jgi:hypothetical protein